MQKYAYQREKAPVKSEAKEADRSKGRLHSKEFVTKELYISSSGLMETKQFLEK